MLDSRRQRWLSYIRLVADRYGLKDWEFGISDDPPSDIDALASTVCVLGRKYAYIRFAGDFLNDTPIHQRWVVLHELTHCHFTFAQMLIDEHVSGDLKLIYHQLNEFGIDGVAQAIAEYFPLPEINNDN